MNDLLNEREKTHGDYGYTAKVAQELKAVVRETRPEERLTEIQLESLDLTCTKIARILSGNPNSEQHWEDIVGYAQLVVNDLEAKPSTEDCPEGASGLPQPKP